MKYCRTYSVEAIIISWSVRTNEHLDKAVFGRVCFHSGSCEFNFSMHPYWDFFTRIFAFCIKLICGQRKVVVAEKQLFSFPKPSRDAEKNISWLQCPLTHGDSSGVTRQMEQFVGNPNDDEKSEMAFSLGKSFLGATSVTAAVAGWGEILARVLQTAGAFLIVQGKKKSSKAFHSWEQILCRWRENTLQKLLSRLHW